MSDADRCVTEAAQAEAALRAGEPHAHELLIWRADWELGAALEAGELPKTIQRFLVRCGAKRGRMEGDGIARSGNSTRFLNIPTIGGGPHV